MKKTYYPVIILFSLFCLSFELSAQDQKDTIAYKAITLELHDLARTGFIPDTLAKYQGGVDGIRLQP